MAIASLDSPSVPKAVGSCLIDIASLRTTQGAKGHAVETMHWAGDELWSFSTTNKPGKPPPTELEGWLEHEDADQMASVTKGTNDLDLDDEEEGGVDLGQTSTAGQGAGSEVTSDNVVIQQDEGEDAAPDRKPLSVKGDSISSRSKVCMLTKL